MPIIDIQLVMDASHALPAGIARSLADKLGEVLHAEPGHVWVRLAVLPATGYAENGVETRAHDLPAFVTVLHANPPDGIARTQEAAALCHEVARCIGRRPEQVHVEYAAPGAGRFAFGGRLVVPHLCT